jgi:hypothetical protein
MTLVHVLNGTIDATADAFTATGYFWYIKLFLTFLKTLFAIRFTLLKHAIEEHRQSEPARKAPFEPLLDLLHL